MTEKTNTDGGGVLDIQAMFLSEDEVNKLVMTYLYKRPDHGASEALVRAVVEWADQARFAVAMLDNILGGEMFIHLDAADEEPTFSLTPRGEANARQIGERLGVRARQGR
jgi:hypothetical protein